MNHQTPVVIAVVNNKGGVGKTTTAVNLAATLAAPRRDVLLVDLDSHASCSLWLGVDSRRLLPSAANSLLKHLPLHKAIRPTAIRHLDMVTGSLELASVDLALADVPGRESVLRRALVGTRHQYAVVLLDCPPGLSLVTINALVAADLLIIPVTPQHLSVQGLVATLESVERVRARLGAKARVLGILLTRTGGKRAAAAEVGERLRAEYRDLVFHTEILESATLEEAPAKGTTAIDFPPRSKSGDAYFRLAGELLERLRLLH